MMILTWFTEISPTLIPFIIETVGGVISYNPQWAIRQLGDDQWRVIIKGEMTYSNLFTTEPNL